MQRQVTIILNVRTGKTWRTAMDVLDLAAELFDKLPEWLEPEKNEMKQRCAGLIEAVTAELGDQIRKGAK